MSSESGDAALTAEDEAAADDDAALIAEEDAALAEDARAELLVSAICSTTA